MAVRTPMLSSSGNPREFTASQITSCVDECIQTYQDNPSVVLTVVSSGGTLGNIGDTRLQAGSANSTNSSFPSAADTPDVSVVTVNYARITQTLQTANAPADTNGRGFPVYLNASNNLQSMTLQDMIDTFADPAIDTLFTNMYYAQAGTTKSGWSLSSSTPVFTDTRANAAAYTSAGVPETQDQPTTITNYYLFKKNSTANTPTVPLYINSSGHLQEYSTSAWSNLLRDLTRYAAVNVSGQRLRYNWNGSGTNTSAALNDTRLSGSTRLTNQVNDDYYSQEVPSGSVVTHQTHRLKVTRT